MPDPGAAAVTAATTAREHGSLLRLALTLDAAVTGANGLAYLVAAGPLGDLFGLDSGLLRGVGAFLVAFAVLVAAAARSATPAPALVVSIIVANACWSAMSVVAALAGWGSPDTVGTVWIVMQAVVVGAFAELQTTGLRRLRGT